MKEDVSLTLLKSIGQQGPKEEGGLLLHLRILGYLLRGN